MNFKEIRELPDDGFKVAASLYGVVDEKIIVGGGSGFIKPLCDGGPKCLSSKVRLLEEKNDDWLVLDEIEIKVDNKHVGFCNGASYVVNNKIYYFAGLISVDGKISNSSSIIEISVINNKLNYKFLNDVLPFSGEVAGTKYNDDYFIICGKKNYLINIKDSEFFVTENFINPKVDISGALPISPKRDILYLIGGYVPYDENMPDSNYFSENRMLVFEKGEIREIQLKNIENNPAVFLGSSIIAVDYENLLIVGGVNKKIFLDAVFNLSTLKGFELDKFKKEYFNMTEKEFSFNNKLLWINLKSLNVLTLYEFNQGYAGNPAFVNIGNTFYILNGEVKAGVRLVKPVKFEFK